MGVKQSKRSVDITSTPAADGVAVNGKEVVINGDKIIDDVTKTVTANGDSVAVTANGDANGEAKKEDKKEEEEEKKEEEKEEKKDEAAAEEKKEEGAEGGEAVAAALADAADEDKEGKLK